MRRVIYHVSNDVPARCLAAAQAAISRGRLTAACGDERDQQRFGGGEEARQGMARDAGCAAAAVDQRARPEYARTRPAVGRGESTARRANRRSCRDSARHRATIGRARRSGARRRGGARMAHGRARRRPAGHDDAGLRPMSARIGKQHRDGVAGAGLDAKVTPARREAEDQDDVRLCREQFWQIAIDRRIDRREDVRDAIELGQSRPPPARERLDQRRAWIERRAGERAEADDDRTRVTISALRRFPRPPWPAPAGRPRPRLRSAATPP